MDGNIQGEYAKREGHGLRIEPRGILTFKGKMEEMKEKEKE